MLQSQFAVYLGKENEEGFSGFIAQDNFFAIIEIPEGLGKDEGRVLLKKIHQEVLVSEIRRLLDFETIIENVIKNANIPLDFSLAAGFYTNGILFIKTIGKGDILVRRGRNFTTLIEGVSSASGHIQEQDFFIFSTSIFSMKLGGKEKIAEIFDHKNPHEIVDEVTPFMKEQEDKGTVALFVLFEGTVVEQLTTEETYVEEDTVKKPLFINILKQKLTALSLSSSINTRKKLTFIVIGIVVIVLVWSVVFGSKRRNEERTAKQIAVSQQKINQKLQEAEDVAFLNMSRALVLIAESKSELASLKKTIGVQNEKEIQKIVDVINEKESKLMKKEEKQPEEFYDISIENKTAKGSAVSLYNDSVAILDKNGVIYILSLEKKSIKKETASEIKQASLVALYQNTVFFYTPDGVYTIENNKSKKVIEKDKEWGTIVDMQVYNGNIYLADTQKDEIYKYITAEGGYSGKSSYFKSGGVSLSGLHSLSIDSSVYLGFSDYIIKYTAGERDGFKTTFPEENVKLSRLFTNKDVEKIYALDTQKGALYTLEKSGTYVQETDAKILTRAYGFVVYNNAAYILLGSKIYKIGL